MCHFDSVVPLGVEPDNQAFDQLCNVFLLFSGVILSIRLFFTILISTRCPKKVNKFEKAKLVWEYDELINYGLFERKGSDF